MDEKTTDIFIEMSRQLGSIDSKLDVLVTTIEKHEARICKLEEKTRNYGDSQGYAKDTFKDKMLETLTKALIYTIMIIGSLTGSSALISKVFGT